MALEVFYTSDIPTLKRIAQIPYFKEFLVPLGELTPTQRVTFENTASGHQPLFIRVNIPNRIERMFGKKGTLEILDGHHRYFTAKHSGAPDDTLVLVMRT